MQASPGVHQKRLTGTSLRVPKTPHMMLHVTADPTTGFQQSSIFRDNCAVGELERMCMLHAAWTPTPFRMQHTSGHHMYNSRRHLQEHR